MSHELKEGMELSRIAWPESKESMDANFYSTTGLVQSITIVMQQGQMGMVPWAKVTHVNGHTLALVNVAQCVYVELRNGG